LIFGRHAEEGCFAVIVEIGVLDSFLDESSDQKQEHVFCVAAFLAQKQYWQEIQGRWMDRLAQDGVKYFSAKDCNSVHGPFEHLHKLHGLEKAKQITSALRNDLANILIGSHWHGFGFGVLIPDYKDVLAEFPIANRFYAADPTEHIYSQAMYEVTRATRRKAKGWGVAFVIDQSDYDEYVIAAYKAMKVNQPAMAESAKTILPRDDKETPPLQMADLLASVTKDMFLDWVTNHPNQKTAPIPKRWFDNFEKIGKWDRAFMLHSLDKTLSSPRYAKDKLAHRALRKIKLSKKQAQKQLRKQLIAAAKEEHEKSE
jgi:hypothetical protein